MKSVGKQKYITVFITFIFIGVYSYTEKCYCPGDSDFSPQIEEKMLELRKKEVDEKLVAILKPSKRVFFAKKTLSKLQTLPQGTWTLHSWTGRSSFPT